MHSNAVWAESVDQATVASVSAMLHAIDKDWSVLAGDLEWSCRETARHIASDFVGYAAQLTAPREYGFVPFDLVLDGTPDGAGLCEVVRGTGGMLSAVVRFADSAVRSWHPYGVAGPIDFAAMGIVEVLVHTEDLSRGLGFAWEPPKEICVQIVEHLFPEAPEGFEPWATLLWSTGRIALGEHPRQQNWSWTNTGS
jgi:hypothetical protein